MNTKKIQNRQQICPFCAQPIDDVDKIPLNFIRAVTFSEVLRVYAHSARNHLENVNTVLFNLKLSSQFRQSKNAVEAIENASKALYDLRGELESIFDSFRPQTRDDRPLTEAEIRDIHLSLDESFRFRCEYRESGLKARSLDVGVSMYRNFMHMILVLSLLAVGRQPRPQIVVQYLGDVSFVSCEVRLRNGATLELDEMQFNLASIMARRIGIPLQSEIQGEDRLFHWKIPLSKN